MSYAILRIQKCKTLADVGSRAAHNLRQHATAAPHADPALRGKNAVLVGPSGEAGEVVEAVRSRLANVGKVRSNAVLAVEMVLTASPEFFTDKTRTPKEHNQWLRDSMGWVNDTFGAENIVSAVLHRDEGTPHIQLILTPIHSGKLRAAHWFDGPAKLAKLQDGYAARMEPLRLRRGVKGSKASHVRLKEFYRLAARVTREIERQAKAQGSKPPALPTRGLLGNVSSADWNRFSQGLERYGREFARLAAEAEAAKQLASSKLGEELRKRQEEAEASLRRTRANLDAAAMQLLGAKGRLAETQGKVARLEKRASELQELVEKRQQALGLAKPAKPIQEPVEGLKPRPKPR